MQSQIFAAHETLESARPSLTSLCIYSFLSGKKVTANDTLARSFETVLHRGHVVCYIS
jgi:hypothetical protein